jgi:ATP-dependent Clp protease ATP-binding subunit ClpB
MDDGRLTDAKGRTVDFKNTVLIMTSNLGAAQMAQILNLRLDEVRKLLEERQISLELTEPARQLILAAGSDAAYGARPLKRALQRMIQDPLAIKILNGEVLHRAHVRIDVDHKTNQLKFEPMSREAMA